MKPRRPRHALIVLPLAGAIAIATAGASSAGTAGTSNGTYAAVTTLTGTSVKVSLSQTQVTDYAKTSSFDRVDAPPQANDTLQVGAHTCSSSGSNVTFYAYPSNWVNVFTASKGALNIRCQVGAELHQYRWGGTTQAAACVSVLRGQTSDGRASYALSATSGCQATHTVIDRKGNLLKDFGAKDLPFTGDVTLLSGPQPPSA